MLPSAGHTPNQFPQGHLLPDQEYQVDAYGGAASLTFGSLMTLLAPFLKGLVVLWTLVMVAGALKMYFSEEAYTLPFVIVAAASLVPLWLWLKNPAPGLSYIIFFVIQQGLFNLMPLFTGNPALIPYSQSIILEGALSVALFLVVLAIGWYLGHRNVHSRPSKLNISGEDRENAHVLAMRISMFLLTSAVIGQIIPFYLHLGGLLPILTAGFNAGATLGALLGGYSIGISKKNYPPYWMLIGLLFFIAIHDVLLSAAESFVVASILGLALGSKRIPWVALLITVGIITFLSAGKFTLREKYWKVNNTTGVTLMGLPALYTEWSRASIEALSGQTDQATLTARQVRESNTGAFGERINNFQNMTFVLRAQEEQSLSLLEGATYTLIPPLLMPRILWPSKPRAHAGQDLLNIHYLRQREVDVERTFVAWGLLPEAVGNFGPWFGAIFLGVLVGYLLGYLETWSLQKELFSVEGLILLGVWLQLLASQEMVASVLVTATFQMLVVITLGGGMLRSIFGAGRERA